MNEIQLPLCALIFSFLLTFVFLSKKRIKLIENDIYKYMLIFGLLYSVIIIIERLIVFDGNLELISDFMKSIPLITNRINFLILLSFSSCVLIYTFIITYPKIREKINKIYIIFISANIFTVILTFFLKMELIASENKIISVTGSAFIPIFLVGGIYLLSAILITLFNYKKFTIRHIPIIGVILVFFLLMYSFIANPYIMIYSISVTFINYLMFFTIENPDIRMIEALNISKSEAERANMAKSDFLASMSHEIRTPLNAITGFSHAILANGNLSPEVEDYAKDIVKSSDTLLEIVGGVLDVSKIESNKMEIIEVLYKPKEEFENLAKLAKSRLGEKPIIFNYKIAEDVPYQLYGDKANLKKIVTNLLTNAVKYTHKGNILFNVKCINKENMCYLIISVQDTGMGIKEENITRLFTKFDRLDVAKNTTAEGTGLGLAITKKLVELMGGKINVKSQYGNGSIFMVQIPQRLAMMSKPLTDTQMLSTLEITKKREESEAKINGQRILIVDDNALNIKVAKVALKNFKLQLDDVISGEESIEKIKSGERYDLILMDIMMPNMSGEEAFRELKKITGFNTPVIALTADAISGSKEKYLAEGFAGYISKPFSPDEIKAELLRIFK